MSRTSYASRIAAPVVAGILAVVAAFSLAGCSLPFNIVKNSTPPELGASTLESGSTISEGTLIVGINASNAPFGGMNAEGAIVGLDADIAGAIGDELGLKVELVDVGTKGRGAITNGNVDLVLGSTKAGTNSDISYSDAYLNNGVALYCLNENLPSSIADVDYKDAKIIVVAGTASASAVEEVLKGHEDMIVECESLEAAFTALAEGEAPYLADDAASGDYTARGYESISRVDFVGADMIHPVYALTSMDNPGLSVAVNSTLKQLVDNGIMQAILNKWLGSQSFTLLPGKVSLDALPAKFTAGIEPGEDDEDATDAEEGNGDDAAAASGTEGAAAQGN